jgi:hypothetical protein
MFETTSITINKLVQNVPSIKHSMLLSASISFLRQQIHLNSSNVVEVFNFFLEYLTILTVPNSAVCYNFHLGTRYFRGSVREDTGLLLCHIARGSDGVCVLVRCVSCVTETTATILKILEITP